MKAFKMTISGVERELPYIHINDTLAYAAFISMGDVEILEATAKDLVEKIGDVDIVITAEAKGIPIAHEVSRLLGHKDYVVARKSVKTYMENVISQDVQSITTAEPQKLYLADTEVAKLKGKRICVVDDVISTGESLKSIELLAEQAGGTVVSRAAILAEGDAANRDDLIFVKKLPLFSVSEGVYTPIG